MKGTNWSKDNRSYTPLPSFLTIKPSPIHGLGLFASDDIPSDYIIGVSHIKDKRFPNGYIRTPLGAFVNYSSSPNSTVITDGDFEKLKTLKMILAGEELTTDYSAWYDEKTLAKFI